MNHQTRPAPGGAVNFGYQSKTGKNIVKVQATDIRKGTGFDEAQRILQNNVILNLVLWLVQFKTKIITKNYMASYKKSLLKTESKCVSGQAQGVTRVPSTMDQNAKDTRDTSDHKCILIQNPAYKYKHYKFLKSEGLVDALPVQRLPQKLHSRPLFKPAVHSL